IVYGQRECGCVAPTRATLATFEKWETVGIEKRTTERGQPKRLVLNAAEHGAEHGEQSRPRIMPTFQHFVAEPFLVLAQAGTQRRDRVVLVVNRFTEQQKFAFLCAE